MKVLVDTHCLLWLVDESSHTRIPPPALAAVVDPTNDLLISAITPWELSLKYWLGKLPEAFALLAAWEDTVKRLRATVLSLTGDHGIVAGQLDWAHKDPFDRMIAAQAVIENAALISADTVFDSVSGMRRIWN